MPTEMATFETLLDLPPRERSRRLAELRADAAGVAVRLERLLGFIADDLAELDAEADDPRLGTRIDRWTLERRIGEGASSIVYLGRADDGSEVALKILRLERLGESSRRRFEREIAAHARLDHPGFARLVTSDLAATPPWLAAEWVEDGLPITDWASLHAPSIDDRVRLVEQLREALGAAREAGVVHRDLSPNNVLVDRHGRVKIVDLGIARLFAEGAESAGFSRTGRHAIGTPAYMAPEQVDPSFGPIGPWTDEYAAALIAYRLFTGKLPYDTSGSLASVAQAIVHVPVEDVRSSVAAVPASTAEWIIAGLAKHPAKRGENRRRVSRGAGAVLIGSVHARIKSRGLGRREAIVIGCSALLATSAASLVLTSAFPRNKSSDPEPAKSQGESEMNVRTATIAATTGLLLQAAQTAAAAEGSPAAVQWRQEDGGNGHWYWGMLAGGDFWQKQAFAVSLGGHLATVHSLAENEFIASVVPSINWSQEACSAYLGGYQDRGSQAFAEPSGGWRWVTGEPFTFMNWHAGEPNNHVAGEDFLGFWRFDCGYAWNDGLNTATDVPIAFIIEWSADCNGDGIVDFGQIRDGQLDDANGNNIPDCCEQGTSCDPCPGDLDGSGAVNSVDLAIILGAWGTAGGKYPQADINGSGSVDASDLSVVLAAWGPCPN
jgi:serine/threonine protein kinase